MNWKTWVPLGVAIVLGLLAAKLSGNLISKSRAATGGAAPLVHVAMARRDIPPGQTIAPEDLVLGQIPAGAGTEETFSDISSLSGRVLTAQISRGQAIVRPLLAPESSGSGLQVLIPDGMRAITVEVNEFSGLAGLVMPGCRVDLIATLHKEADADTIAKTIVQNVKVSAVGQRMGNAGGGKGEDAAGLSRSITLLVTPQEAEGIQLACTTGRPWLVLRGNKDDKQAPTSGVSLNQLRAGSTTNPSSADPFAELPLTRPAQTNRVFALEQPSQRTVHLIRNGAESSVVLDMPAAKPNRTQGK